VDEDKARSNELTSYNASATQLFRTGNTSRPKVVAWQMAAIPARVRRMVTDCA